MSLSETPSAELIHIGFFSRRNAGKFSLINVVMGQPLSIVSPIKGTTTDPGYKAMELLPSGPVVIIDTPGLDDEGDLGELKVQRSLQALRRSDVAVVVMDAAVGFQPEDEVLIHRLQQQNVPHLWVWNKADLPGAIPLEKEAIHDSDWPTPFVSGLEYGAPARGPWNIVHVGMLMPEAHQVYVGALGGLVLTAAEMGASKRFSTITVRNLSLGYGTADDRRGG